MPSFPDYGAWQSAPTVARCASAYLLLDRSTPVETCTNAAYVPIFACVRRVRVLLSTVSAEFAELPKSFKQLRIALMKRDGGDREMADILALVLHHDEKLVEPAVREAIAPKREEMGGEK